MLSWPPGFRVDGATLPAVRTPPHTVPASPCLSLPRGPPFLTWGTAGPGPWGAVGPQGQWEQWLGGLGQAGAGHPVNQRTDDEGKWDPH